MMKWIPVVLALCLAACSSEGKKTYYQLPVISSSQPSLSVSASRASVNATPRLWISQVTVADFLGSAGLVYQTNDVQYVMAANNLWASPLDQQLRQSLQSYLGSRLPGWVVSEQQGPDANQQQLTVNVTGFHGRYDGRAVVSGTWTLSQNGQLRQHRFNIELKQDQDGYDALVRTLAKGWEQEASSIASEIR
ncbi:membrane integrity-associated transporter subunit PqiC [Rahnella sp. SAP-1]|uniref:Membrane integrity-associated transporter subunit PqiC n=1 Tax=Rouxiella aceris TaxID=2703884 RepID=A0A848MIV6_9GAMM|nr:membrane integrity-associated transporter subunit PqiC [Rouxiella aceris]NMP27069.1 membrane integrity-associated transporter subunit PqiC [Rouxiella aceris]